MPIWMQSTRAAAVGTLLAGLAGPAAGQKPAPCPTPSSGRGVVEGFVLDEDTRVPLARAEVQISWKPEGERQRASEIEADGRGFFRFCEAPADQRLVLKASFAGKSGRGEPVQVASGGRAEVQLEVDAPHSEIVGRVVAYGTSQPIAGATIRLRGTPLTQVTPQDGKFRFAEVPPGGYEIEIQHVGFRGVQDSVSLELGTNMDVTVRLAPNVIPLEPLVVSVRSVNLERYGFYERQQRGLGSYITREDFEQRLPLQASELLRGLAGVQLMRRPDGPGFVPVGRGSCGFRYVLNGARVGAGFEIDDIAPEWIEAIEVYRGPASIPIEFAPMGTDYRANCGVIVIWTRNR